MFKDETIKEIIEYIGDTTLFGQWYLHTVGREFDFGEIAERFSFCKNPPQLMKEILIENYRRRVESEVDKFTVFSDYLKENELQQPELQMHSEIQHKEHHNSNDEHIQSGCSLNEHSHLNPIVIEHDEHEESETHAIVIDHETEEVPPSQIITRIPDYGPDYYIHTHPFCQASYDFGDLACTGIALCACTHFLNTSDWFYETNNNAKLDEDCERIIKHGILWYKEFLDKERHPEPVLARVYDLIDVEHAILSVDYEKGGLLNHGRHPLKYFLEKETTGCYVLQCSARSFFIGKVKEQVNWFDSHPATYWGRETAVSACCTVDFLCKSLAETFGDETAYALLKMVPTKE